MIAQASDIRNTLHGPFLPDAISASIYIVDSEENSVLEKADPWYVL